MDKKDYMQRAIDLAREKMLEGRGHWPYGCLIVKDGEIVGEGCNDMGFSLDPRATARSWRSAMPASGSARWTSPAASSTPAASPARSAPAQSG